MHLLRRLIAESVTLNNCKLRVHDPEPNQQVHALLTAATNDKNSLHLLLVRYYDTPTLVVRRAGGTSAAGANKYVVDRKKDQQPLTCKPLVWQEAAANSNAKRRAAAKRLRTSADDTPTRAPTGVFDLVPADTIVREALVFPDYKMGDGHFVECDWNDYPTREFLLHELPDHVAMFNSSS